MGDSGVGCCWSGFGGGTSRGSVGSSSEGGSLPGAPGTGLSANETASATASATSPAAFLAAATGFLGLMFFLASVVR